MVSAVNSEGVLPVLGRALPHLPDGPLLSVTIIPHTYANTTIGQARVGSRINIEVDVLAKHVEKLLGGKA